MAFNKNKALESALKYLNQGKIAQAISEYQQILRYDAKDQATLMTVGDLYARQGDMSHAIEYFERLAQVYLADGFNSKAIAIYKKIAKLAPAELAPLERLADLYVQQGVLSEARPLFLQIAEAHLKANRSQRAVEVLHRLLEVEPENPRVQMRLAELYNVMGQKKDAAQTYVNYAQRLMERGETDEAHKLVDRALEVDSTNTTAVLLKGKVLIAAKDTEQAIKVLASHPEADAGGEVTDLLIDLEIESGHAVRCAERARKQLARGSTHFRYLLKVTDAIIAAGQTEEALPLLRELRDPMIETSEQDKFLKSLTNVTRQSPDSIEALELLVNFCRHTSDPFQLSAALGQLADAYTKTGNYSRAEELLQEFADRNKDDERVLEKLKQLRARVSGSPEPASIEESLPAAPLAPEPEQEETPAPSPEPFVEPALDEETERYIAQALTDVDLFSSYGLTQKATHLLENVLQRAPRHTPTLERLLDLYLGAGKDQRTAETAALLEQIHRQRNDTVNSEHFAELKQRFQKAAGLGEEQLPIAPPPASAPTTVAPAESAEETVQPAAEVPAESAGAAEAKVQTAEFEVPVMPVATEAEHSHAPQAPIADAALTPAADLPTPQTSVPAEPARVTEEVDLSDEWEAMAQEVVEPPAAPEAESAAEPIKPPAEPAQAPQPAETTEVAPTVPTPAAAEPQPVEAQAASQQETGAEPAQVELEESAPQEMIELVDESTAEEPAVSAGSEIAQAIPTEPHAEKTPVTADDLISQLVAEIDQEPVPAAPAAHGTISPVQSAEPPQSDATIVAEAPDISAGIAPPPTPVERQTQQPAQEHAPVPEPVSEPAPQATPEVLNELAEVFQEFRSELGELDEEDGDLETHYNLGIAYREMGLLDEAIGEFQRVAKAIQKGKPFPYAMNCATLLALSFMDKGEPKIASLWYLRALETPGLDQENVLALRYDLGIALESAGESKPALDSFQQVYAMNIDYRDVAERIAALQKHATHV